ncbi:MAG: D-lyxose/D-mannose family sugar isomerase [Planctomycetota bacterium]
MKRSEINAVMREAKTFLAEHRFLLPPFAEWSPTAWKEKGPEVAEIVDCQMGWDITDFGRGDFSKYGLFLFTIRNGLPERADEPGAKNYAEKIMIVREGQWTPMHFHFFKTEDIINRGGGNLIIQVYNADEQEELADTEVVLQMDGVTRTCPAGAEVVVRPGESMTIPTRLYHAFWAEPGAGTALIGEVSRVNDDHEDNRFHQPIGRFPEIEEDEEPMHLLVGDYETYYFPDSKE